MKSFSRKLISDFEKKANLTMAFICRIIIGLMAAVVVLNMLNIFIIGDAIYPAS